LELLTLRPFLPTSWWQLHAPATFPEVQSQPTPSHINRMLSPVPGTLFKIKGLSTNIKLTFHKALIRSVMTYACPVWEFAPDPHVFKLQRLQNIWHRWQFSKTRNDPRVARGFQNSVRV
jgi:hypothetical protein